MPIRTSYAPDLQSAIRPASNRRHSKLASIRAYSRILVRCLTCISLLPSTPQGTWLLGISPTSLRTCECLNSGLRLRHRVRRRPPPGELHSADCPRTSPSDPESRNGERRALHEKSSSNPVYSYRQPRRIQHRSFCRE